MAEIVTIVEKSSIKQHLVFHSTKLDSEINASFLLNEHGDPYFLSQNFNEDNFLNN